MRIVVVDRKKCAPEKCASECSKFCPIQREGKEIIKIPGGGTAIIDEDLCIGCGICVHKCPFDAIRVINLPEGGGSMVHRYGQNGFSLFGLPSPTGSVGLVGPNGTGKSTIAKIFSGQLIPNFGTEEESKEKMIELFSGSELGTYFKNLYDEKLTISFKPQEITKIPKHFKGSAESLLTKISTDKDKLKELSNALGITQILTRSLSDLSGGELQRVAITAALLKDSDLTIVDEPGSFLDVYERLRVAEVLRKYSKRLFVIEHDLIMLDYLADTVNLMYGRPGVFGIVSLKKNTRVGVNEFLDGFLVSENVRIRDSPLKFLIRPSSEAGVETLTKFPEFTVDLGGFKLTSAAGEIKKSEIIGILGRNALGKTTWVRTLAGQIEASLGKLKTDLKISYKPQYIEPEEIPVALMFKMIEKDSQINLNRDIYTPLELSHLLTRNVTDLSGGELQRLTIGLCLAQEADLYLFDEPSAYLDSEQRIKVAKLIRRLTQSREKATIVVEHDLMLIDYLSDRLMLFTGTPGVEGHASIPKGVKEGMNDFLQDVNITLRRDPQSRRPRINKVDSNKDKELRAKNQFYEV